MATTLHHQNRRMPEKGRLSKEAYRRAIFEAPPDLWIVARVPSGEVLGSGATSPEALNDASARHPGLKVEEIAILRNLQTSRQVE